MSNNTCASSACKFKCTFPRSSIHFFYFNRVVRIWNSLPIINLSLSSSTIKKLIKNFLWQHFLSTFNPHNTCSWFFCCTCHLCLSIHHISFIHLLEDNGRGYLLNLHSQSCKFLYNFTVEVKAVATNGSTFRGKVNHFYLHTPEQCCKSQVTNHWRYILTYYSLNMDMV